jgi:hypothetical protein
LTKINDISSFISKSIEDLEGIAMKKDFEKGEALLDPALKPLSLNVHKAFELISKFNMVPHHKKNNDNNIVAAGGNKQQTQIINQPQQQLRGYSSGGTSNYPEPKQPYHTGG